MHRVNVRRDRDGYLRDVGLSVVSVMARVMLAPAAGAAAAPAAAGDARAPATWSDDHVNVRKDADVVFRIGAEKLPLYAHKLMLAEHSRVIRSMKPLQRCARTQGGGGRSAYDARGAPQRD